MLAGLLYFSCKHSADVGILHIQMVCTRGGQKFSREGHIENFIPTRGC